MSTNAIEPTETGSPGRLVKPRRSAELFDDLSEQLDLATGPWLMVAGRPLSPLPATMGRPEPGHVKEVVTDALGVSNQICPTTPMRSRVLGRLEGSAAVNPRIGLRRWVARSNAHAPPGVHTDLIHVELHDNGTSTVAVALGVWASRGTYEHSTRCPPGSSSTR